MHLQSGQQCPRPHWFGHVVIRSGFQSQYLVDLVAARSQHNDRTAILRSDGFADREAIQAGLEGDLSVFETLLTVLSRPFEDDPGFEHLALPPQSHEVVQQTFCGT
jgi:uncharacterized protein YdiU (UPF0061 family)